MPLDSALRGSWKAEGGETKKEVALEKFKGISGQNQVPWGLTQKVTSSHCLRVHTLSLCPVCTCNGLLSPTQAAPEAETLMYSSAEHRLVASKQFCFKKDNCSRMTLCSDTVQ